MSDRVFVGRQTELAALRAALERALAGRGAVCLVVGEPGIGKSELADRLAAEATARGAEVLWGRSWEGEGAPPYGRASIARAGDIAGELVVHFASLPGRRGGWWDHATERCPARCAAARIARRASQR